MISWVTSGLDLLGISHSNITNSKTKYTYYTLHKRERAFISIPLILYPSRSPHHPKAHTHPDTYHAANAFAEQKSFFLAKLKKIHFQFHTLLNTSVLNALLIVMVIPNIIVNQFQNVDIFENKFCNVVDCSCLLHGKS